MDPVCGEMFYYLAHSGFSQWSRPKIPHQSLERVLEPFHLEDAVVFRFPGRVKPEHAKVIRVRKDQDTGERMYDVSSSEQKMNLNLTWSRRWRRRDAASPRRRRFRDSVHSTQVEPEDEKQRMKTPVRSPRPWMDSWPSHEAIF